MAAEMKNDGQSNDPVAKHLLANLLPVGRTHSQKALILANLTLFLASLDKEEGRQHGNT